MTKSEKRKARKAVKAAGKPLNNELRLSEPVEFSESPRGYHARYNWARYYDSLNGAPENDGDV